jgi:hypothetical protein
MLRGELRKSEDFFKGGGSLGDVFAAGVIWVELAPAAQHRKTSESG